MKLKKRLTKNGTFFDKEKHNTIGGYATCANETKKTSHKKWDIFRQRKTQYDWWVCNLRNTSCEQDAYINKIAVASFSLFY